MATGSSIVPISRSYAWVASLIWSISKALLRLQTFLGKVVLMLLSLGFQEPSYLHFVMQGAGVSKVLPSGVGESCTNLQFRWPVALRYRTSIIHTICS